MKRIEIIGVDTSSLPKISGEESRQYLLEIKNGNEEKKNEFINANIRLVLSIVQRFSNGRGEADDLFQVGCVGLLKALNNFDVTQNVRFSTYAVPMIIGEIRRFQRESTGIKVSRSQRDVAYRVFSARERMGNTGADISACMSEIAKEIDVPASEIACALDAVSEPVSYYESVYNDDGDAMMLMDQLADKKNTDEKWTESIDLSEAVQKVSEREREILYLRYFAGKTQVEISKAVNVSQAQVSRLEKSAIETIRKYLQ